MSAERNNDERDYDELVNWQARLAREGGFYRRLFASHGVRSVADVGAGSGRHAIMYRSWGLDVWAIDPSEEMIALARENIASAGSDVRLVQGGFGEVATLLGSKVDAITCTGNALPHVRTIRSLHDTLRDFAAALRPGGLLVLHYLNHYRLISQGIRTMSPVFRETPSGDKYFLKVLDYTEERDGILFDFVTLVRDPAVHGTRHNVESWPKSLEDDASGGWRMRPRRSMHLAIPYDMIVPELEGAGFMDVEVYGDHTGAPLDPDADESIIVVAVRASLGPRAH